MKCPYCGSVSSRVLNSRANEDSSSIRRRRECTSCLRRFTTYEKISETPLIVIKKDGRKEMFDPNKILKGLVRAGEKRDIPFNVFEELVAETERELRSTYEKEVSTYVIGNIVLGKLRHVDEVAYVRFASVYRDFKDILSFKKELDELLQTKK
ncbi:MAG TPA: transcriptional repressor NrdR [Firmicutes bacterium]|nr:transcriptional repressor NrdR [Bacillota bacterium]